MVFEGQNGLISQTFAATTNGIFGNQTFGITSGTSNCEQYKTFAYNEKLNTFVADNMDNLARDIARGQGEYLNTLAVLMEVPDTREGCLSVPICRPIFPIFTPRIKSPIPRSSKTS